MDQPGKIRTGQIEDMFNNGGYGHYKSSKTLTIIGSPKIEDITLFSAESILMITEIRATIKGTNPGVTIHPYYTSNLEVGAKIYLMEEPLVVNNGTVGNLVIAFKNAIIPNNAFVVLSFTAVNPGSVNENFSVTFKFIA